MDLAAFGHALSVWLIPIVTAITIHEAAHGWMAGKLGDDTARRLGRVTINPLRHVDPFGTLLLPGLMLIASGGQMAFGWAKPVPVDFRRLANPKRDMVWVALAGPAVNILMALGAALLLHGARLLPDPVRPWVGENLVNAIPINVALATFNMIPLPPLDGGRVLTGILPMPLARRFARIERYGLILLILLIFVIPFAAGELGYDFHPLAELMLPVIEHLTVTIYRVTGLLG